MGKKIFSILKLIIKILLIIVILVFVIGVLEVNKIIYMPEKISVLKFYNEIIKNIDLPVTEEITEKISNFVKEESGETISVEIPGQIEIIDNSKNPANKLNSVSKNQSYIYETNNKFYYNQLDEYGKIIYDGIIENIDNLKTGTYVINYGTKFDTLCQQENGTQLLESSFQSALNGLIYDNPELFYIDITKMYLFTETTSFLFSKTVKVSIGPEDGNNYYGYGFNSAEDVDIAINYINQKIDSIGLKNLNSPTEKIKRAHDYLVDNVEYDKTLSESNIYNMYSTMTTGKSVCEGYAKAFKYMMDFCGVETVFVFGSGNNSQGQIESHAWNYVKINGNWYAVDVTWDDPIITYGHLTQESKYKYYLKGSRDFFKDHTEDGKIEGSLITFKYPTLTDNNY